MIKCITIDDEPLALRQIGAYVDRTERLELVAACRSAAEAQRCLEREAVDLIFVDVNMPDMNGVDFVRGLTNPPMVIFTTAYSEYAIEGFRLDAVDYLLKPFSYADFSRAVEKARSLIELQRFRHASEAVPEVEPVQQERRSHAGPILQPRRSQWQADRRLDLCVWSGSGGDNRGEECS